MTVHSGVWWPADRAEEQYREIPVEVPPGCAGLTVTLAYTGGVLDLGCRGPAGFRGWSGGARDRYTITPTAATPGYLPGELEPGEWHVMFGLHRVPDAGLPWQLTVELGPAAVPDPPPAPPVPDRPPRRELPAVDGMTWLAGDLHAHTVYSDGTLGIDELAASAASRGLDFLAVTDHNSVSHHPALPAASARAGVILVPGQEVTTDRGHANAFGDIGWIDFRQPAGAWVTDTAARGGLLSINHPLAADCAWKQPLAVRPPLAEVWHWSWLARDWGGPLAWWRAWDPAVTPIGGSDFHSPEQGRPLGSPTTWVLCAEPTVDGVLAGLAAGHTAISADPRGPLLLRCGSELVALGADGALLTDFTGRRTPVSGNRWTGPAPVGPCWLEDGATAVLAISA